MQAESEERHYIYPERLVSINPSYPVSAIKDMDAQTFTASDQYWKWFSDYREKAEASSGLQARMMPYCQALIGNVLAESNARELPAVAESAFSHIFDALGQIDVPYSAVVPECVRADPRHTAQHGCHARLR